MSVEARVLRWVGLAETLLLVHRLSDACFSKAILMPRGSAQHPEPGATARPVELVVLQGALQHLLTLADVVVAGAGRLPFVAAVGIALVDALLLVVAR